MTRTILARKEDGGSLLSDGVFAISLDFTEGMAVGEQGHLRGRGALPSCYIPRMTDPERDEAAILRRYGIEPDPVIEHYKKDIDRTLLRENLRRTPGERWRLIAAANALAEEMRRAGQNARGR